MAITFCPRGIRANAGGPAGYLYNLKEGLNAVGSRYRIIAPLLIPDGKPLGDSDSRPGRKCRSQLIAELRAIAHFFKMGFAAKRQFIDYQNESLVHVHLVSDVFYLRTIMHFRNKIVLTPHSPESFGEEQAALIRAKGSASWECRLAKCFFSLIENYAFMHSDGFVFPSEHSRDLYRVFPGFKKSIDKPTRFVKTGCVKRSITKGRTQYRKEIGIDDDCFVVAYIGRHNTVKGYDLLLNAFDQLKEDPTIRIVCAGAPSTLLPCPKSPNWIELGYIDDAQNLMNAADVLVVPNRSTYYDLVIVEAMSHGTIILTSSTGGNIDIAPFTKGMLLMDECNAGCLVAGIRAVSNYKNDELQKMKDDNRSFYNQYGSLSRFAANYEEAIISLETELGMDAI